MEANKETQPQPPIFGQLKEYVETRIKLAKYKAIDTGSSVAADIIVDIVIIFCFLLGFIFASITLALFLAHVLNSYWEGFGCVTLLYLLIAVIVILCRKSLEKPIINSIITKLFK